jgi:hypothetical protein
MSHIYIIFIIKSVVAIPTTTGEISFIYYLILVHVQTRLQHKHTSDFLRTHSMFGAYYLKSLTEYIEERCEMCLLEFGESLVAVAP